VRLVISLDHHPHPSCNYRGCGFLNVLDDGGLVSHAAVALARVMCQAESMADRGGGGNIGCGHRTLTLAVTDGDTEYVIDLLDPKDEKKLAALSLPHGRLDPETIAELAAPVWDGNNHTPPDVSELAHYSPECYESPGHWDAWEWLGHSTYDDESVDAIVSAAAAVGVHLDEKEVERYVREQNTR
jgi:hypothetical protein